MNRKSLGGLIVLNVVLLFALGLLSIGTPQAQAQLGRQGGNYVMIAGKISGQESKVVYITDANSGKMVALRYDVSKKGLVTEGARDLQRDFSRTSGR